MNEGECGNMGEELMRAVEARDYGRLKEIFIDRPYGEFFSLYIRWAEQYKNLRISLQQLEAGSLSVPEEERGMVKRELERLLEMIGAVKEQYRQKLLNFEEQWIPGVLKAIDAQQNNETKPKEEK